LLVYWHNRSQHVQAGRFNTEEEVLHYVLDPFPWLIMAVYELYHAQQKLYEAENPGADSAASWLSQLAVASTSATSGQSSTEEPAKRADSDAEAAKPKKVKENKTASSGGETKEKDDKIKQLKKKLEKQNKTVANMKKLRASNKKAQQAAATAQQEIAALKAALIIAQGGDQTNVQGLLVPVPQTKLEPKPRTNPTEQEPAPEKDLESEQLEAIQLTSKDSTDVSP
jgi:hypothetical protein